MVRYGVQIVYGGDLNNILIYFVKEGIHHFP